MRIHSVFIALLGWVGCSLLIACSAWAAWSAPRKIASSRVWRYERPLLARDAAGDAVIIWYREEELNETLSGVEAATRRVGRAWLAPVVLRARRQGGVYGPQVAMDSRGNVTAVWGDLSRIEAADHPVRGNWTRALALSRGAEELEGSETPEVASDYGDVKAVFNSRLGRSFTIQLSARGRNRRWRGPRELAAMADYPLQEPQVGVDARGETVVAWVRNGVRRQVQALVLGADGKQKWRRQTLSSGRGNIRELRLAVNWRGDAVLVWRREGHRASAIEAATRVAGRRFGRPTTVSRQSNTELTATIDGHGDAVILFTHVMHPTSTETTAVEAATHRAHRHWSAPKPLVAGRATSHPQIASDPTGGPVMAVWTTGGPLERNGVVEASTRTPHGAWQTPLVISSQDSFLPSLTVSANGDATAAWIREASEGQADTWEAPHTETIETADYQPG
jgi:hypothetical protein